MGVAEKTFGSFVEGRREQCKVRVDELAQALGGSREALYNWIEANRWTRGRIRAASYVLKYSIVSFGDNTVEIEVDDKTLALSVSGWISPKKVRSLGERKKLRSHSGLVAVSNGLFTLVPICAPADYGAAERFCEELRHFDGVNIRPPSPGQPPRAPATLAGVLRPIVFWSKAAADLLAGGGQIEPTWGPGAEFRTALDSCQRGPNKVILVRLDDAPISQSLQDLPVGLQLDARGVTGADSRQGHVVWGSVVEAIGYLRGVRPLQPCLDRVTDASGANHFFAHTVAGGGHHGREVPGYLESLHEPVGDQIAYRVPARMYPDGSCGFRFCTSEHVETGWWWAVLSFGLGAEWRAINISGYREMRFNARADYAGAPLGIRLADSTINNGARGSHNETSCVMFEIGTLWKCGCPYIVRLDELNWGVDAHPENKSAVNRREILHINVGNYANAWRPGPRWIEMKDVVFL